jgi:hypothetical protein
VSASLELWPTSPRRSGPPNLLDRLRRNVSELPCALLLGVQLLAILVYPFLGDSGLGLAAFGLIGLLVLFLAVRAVRATPAHTWVAAGLGVPVAALTIAEGIWPHTDPIVFWSAVLHAVFYFYTGYGLLRYMFADNWVTRDELFATGAAFTVVAWAFAYVYAAAQVVWPGSFVGADGKEQEWFNLLFLSFTNLTSVGLSDVLPIDAHARSLVMVEQVAGVLYVALVIARLVGLTVVRASARAEQSPED